MKPAKHIPIDAIRRDLSSADVWKRGQALHTLLISLDRQPDLQSPAREIFRDAAERESESWIVTTCLLGLEKLESPDITRPYWRRLLWQPDLATAGTVAMSVTHPSHLPMMLELLEARPQYVVRRGVLCGLGRMRDPSITPLLLQLGNDEQIQPSVIVALGDLGDPNAIPWLQALVPNNRPLPEPDERGSILRVGDIAAQAIRQIQARPCTQPPFDAATFESPAALSATEYTAVPPPLPPRPPAMPPLRRNTWQPWKLLHPSLIPLIIVGVEAAWLFFLLATYLFLVGDEKPTFTVSDRLANGLALPLPAIGLLIAIALLLGGRTPKTWHKVVAIIGGLICGYLAIVFGYDFVAG